MPRTTSNLSGSTDIGSLDFMEKKLPPTNKEEAALMVPNVLDPRLLHMHFVTLKKFAALKQANPTTDRIYLLRAQKRYVYWLNMLSMKKFTDLPLPPIDVAYMWYTHCLLPRSYYEDIRRLHGLRLDEVEFPLEQMYELWLENEEHEDPKSKQIWEQSTGQPWYLDPADKSNFEIVCPWCSKKVSISAVRYAHLMEGKFKKCTHCNASLSVSTLSAKRFLDDIYGWIAGTKVLCGPSRGFGGTLLDPFTGEFAQQSAEEKYSIFFDTSSKHIRELVQLSRHESVGCKWRFIFDALKKREKELETSKRSLALINGLIDRMLQAYIDIVSPFSINLIKAVLSKREFIESVLKNPWFDCVGVQAQCVVRYQRFLHVMRNNRYKILVPTLDIDFCWNTHMLKQHKYRTYTNNNFGQLVNYTNITNITNNQTAIEGFAATAWAWYKTYERPYTHEDTVRYLRSNSILSLSNVMSAKSFLVSQQLRKHKKATCQGESIVNFIEVDPIRYVGAKRKARGTSVIEQPLAVQCGCSLLETGEAASRCRGQCETSGCTTGGGCGGIGCGSYIGC